MSLPFLFFSILLSSLALLLFYSLYSRIPQREEKVGASFFYRHGKLSAFWKAYAYELSRLSLRPFLKLSFLCLAFYLCLHLLFPLWGFAFFLRSDGNFLVIIGSVFISLQLHHRLFSSIEEDSQ